MEESGASWASHKMPNPYEAEISEVIEDDDKKWVGKNGILRVPGHPEPILNQDSRSRSGLDELGDADENHLCSLLNTMNSHHSEQKVRGRMTPSGVS